MKVKAIVSVIYSDVLRISSDIVYLCSCSYCYLCLCFASVSLKLGSLC